MSRPDLRVLQVTSALGMGGAETWLMSLLRHWAAESDGSYRVRTDILLTGGRPAVFDDEAKALGARLYYVPYSARRPVRFARGFRAALAAGRYHAVHDHQDVAAGFHFLAGLGRLPAVRIAHVHNPRQTWEKVFGGSRARRLVAATGQRLVATLGTHVQGTSWQVVREYGFDAPAYRRLERGVAHCGFEVDRFTGDRPAARAEVLREFGWGRDARVALFAGRLDGVFPGGLNQKNPAFALAVGRAAARDPRFRLVMAGSGEAARRELEATVRGWGLSDRLLLIGPRSDIGRLMLGCDLLLFPSVAEGLGMVAVEAQAAGLPVLMSDAVPREAVVVPELVTALPLAVGPDHWGETALRLMGQTGPDPAAVRRAVQASPFSIENSACRLVELYSRGLRSPRAYGRG